MTSTVTARRPLDVIAAEIKADWTRPNYAAVPYLDAMSQLSDISQPYYYDSGASIVMYFLANAGTWRGDVARKIKAELNAQLKEV